MLNAIPETTALTECMKDIFSFLLISNLHFPASNNQLQNINTTAKISAVSFESFISK